MRQADTWTSSLMMKTCMPTYLRRYNYIPNDDGIRNSDYFSLVIRGRPCGIVEKSREGKSRKETSFFFFLSFSITEFVRYRSFTLVTEPRGYSRRDWAKQHSWRATDFHSINDRFSSFPLVSVSCGIDRVDRRKDRTVDEQWRVCTYRGPCDVFN